MSAEELGSPLSVKLRTRKSGRVLVQYDYTAWECDEAVRHVASLRKRLTGVSIGDFCRDLDITLESDDF